MKRNNAVIAILAATIFGATIAVTNSLAWMSTTAYMERSHNPIEGLVEDEYYASGTGTSQDPFVITRPRHLYNLAWLQLLGFYNKNSGADDHQFYFKLGNNIDMGEYCAIPPIGTELNPFVGSFDGCGYTISNLKTSNDFTDYTLHPSVISGWNSTYKQPHIVGLFGVVGEYPGGNKNSVYTSAVNKVVNTGVTGANIKTVVLDSLMGVAAGYVFDKDLTDAQTTLSNVAVDNSTIVLPDSGATTNYKYDDQNHYWTTNISDFTLVGYTNDVRGAVKASETMYDVNVDTNITYSASEDGNSNGWGGSINMINMYDRIVDVRENYSTSTTTPAWKKNHVIAPGGEKNTASDTITTASTSMETTNTATLRTFNHSTSGYQHAGNFVTTRRGGSDTILNYNYLQGGTFNVYNYQKLYHHTGYKLTVDGEHYLTSTNIANNGSVTSSNENDAIVWIIPTTGSSGKIYTTYNNANYFLAVNGTTVNLRNTEANGTTWEIDRDASGHIRYVYNGSYLTYDNGWKMVALPEEPEEPEAPTVVAQPNQAEYNARKITAPANADSTYQICYESNGTTYYLQATSSNYSTSTNIFETGWAFSNLSGSSTTIYRYGTSNYLRPGNGSMTIGNSRNWSVSKNGSTYRFSYSSGRNTYYLRFSGTSFTYSTSTTNSYVTVISTATAVNNYNAAIDAEYAAALAEYNQYLIDKADYDRDHATWVTDHADWVDEMNALHPIIATYAEVDGPDIDAVYDRTEYGMEYKSTDTTFFPLNVVKDDETTHTSTTDAIANYFPKETNTGYITIGSNFTSSTTQMTKDNSSMRFSRYNAASDATTNNIKNSFKTGDTSLTNVKTVNASGTVVDINSTLAATYEKYADSKTAFEEILTSDSAVSGGTRYLYGLHFMDATISMDHILNADWVSIGGAEKTNYDLPVNAIDFNLKENGYINFFAGTYFTDTVNSFFSLHKVVRSGNTITNIYEIEEIYKDTSTTAKNHAYVYKLKDNAGNYTYSCPYTFDAAGNKTSLVQGKDPEANNLLYSELPAGYVSASSCVFKTSQIKTNTLSQYYAYYFEIPMNAGEYCLGSVPGGVGGYLLYLDIGANAAKTNRTIFYEKFVVTEKTYNYPMGVSLIVLPDPTDLEATTVVIDVAQLLDASDSACMVIKATAVGEYGIDRNILTNGDDDVALSRENASLAPPIYASEDIVKIHETGSSEAIEPTPKTSSSYDVKRMIYYDYVINSDTLYVTTITDTNNGSGYTRTITQSLYNGMLVTANPTATYTYNGTTDQRSSMKIYNSGNNGVKYTVEQLIDQTASGLYLNASKLSSTEVLTFRLLMSGSSDYDPCATLIAVVDANNLTGTYYLADNFKFELTAPADGSIIVKVSYWDGSTEIYFGTYVVNSGTQVITIVP